MIGRADVPPEPEGSDETGPEEAERAFFGRRKGKRLRDAQETRLETLLPALRIDLPPGGGRIDPLTLFPQMKAGPDEVWLEIGFGGGEHLAAQAAAHPRIGFIGAEAFVNGVVKLLADVEARGLDNVRVRDGDVAPLLARLPDASLGRISLLYPDPWPKRRQRKRRFVSDESLVQIARLLKDGGTFRFASDIDDYAGWTLARAARSPDLHWDATSSRDWLKPFPGWPGTRYEAKAIATGRRPTYLEFARKPR
ncbi:tRNA (guanine(46)-N(7))-methyltransferase TrmB [Methylobacterium sp. NFXW15]|uniref:tRNA (guanine(46)-N(7))-methyltransferase TrmB n=1 Tax=Methylobacterium sp. NFXW15 TaxID=2819512 RepID=UPI003CF867D1